MKKKFIGMTMAALMCGLIASPFSAFANGQEVTTDEKEEETDFMQFSGVVTEREEADEKVTLTVEKEQEDNLMLFPITDEVQLFNRAGDEVNVAEIEVETHVDVYYNKYKPMPLIYPATVVPDFVIAGEQEEGQVKVYKFDENLVSLDNDLKLNIGEDTILVDEKGNSIGENDLQEKELIVFYTVSTKSIPAQTTPSKVIALDERGDGTNDLEQIVEEIIEGDHYMKGNTKMIPLRKVVTELGYTVEWDQKSEQITLRKGNSSFLITVGEQAYGYNKSIRQFQAAPEMKSYTTYVSEDFLEAVSMS